MKKLISVAVLTLLVTSIVTTAFAQKQKSKDEYLKEIATLSNTKKPEDLEKAYQLSKEFFVKYPKEDNENAKKLKGFIKRYRENAFFKSFEEKKYAEFYAIGKEILTEQPDNVEITMNMGYGGYDILLKTNEKTYAEDSLKYCKLTLELMEKGNVPTNFSPFTSKDEALAWMYYVIGHFSSEKDLKESAVNFYKATLYESTIKKSSQPYYVVAYYYEKVYEQAAGDLNAKVQAKTISDADYKTETEKVEKIIDRMMDAYARAYKLGEAEKNPAVTTWKQRLAQIYQYRKKTDAGLDSYITYIVSTPFADPGSF